MSVELLSLHGPLADEQVGWIADLYGPVDAKYRSTDYLRRQFVGNPFGWSVNVFALSDGKAVGHCGVIPFHARRGGKPFVAGKLEALAVDADFRGRRAEDGGSVATDILSRLYPLAVENGTEVVFGLAAPPVARIHVRAGCHQVPTNAPAYTAVVDASAFGRHERSRKRRLGAVGLALAQRALLETAALPRRMHVRLEQPTGADAHLATATAEGDTRWTVSGSDAWDWFGNSGVLRVLELADSRALLRLDESQSATAQIVSWEPRRPGIASALRLLAAAARTARAHRAPTLRFQPWRGDANEALLARACVLTGFVRRPEADILLYPDGPRVDDLDLTPFFYVTF